MTFICTEVVTVGLVSTSSHHRAQTRRRLLSTGSTAVRLLFADGSLASQTGTHLVFEFELQAANLKIEVVETTTDLCAKELEVSVVQSQGHMWP